MSNIALAASGSSYASDSAALIALTEFVETQALTTTALLYYY